MALRREAVVQTRSSRSAMMARESGEICPSAYGIGGVELMNRRHDVVEGSNDRSPGARSLEPYVRAVSLVAIGVVLVLIARRLPLNALAGSLEGWVRGLGVWGPLAFAAVYVVAVVALLPASALTIVAGAIFGPIVGTAVVSVGSNVGAGLAFLIARHLARDAVVRRARRYPQFDAIDRAIGEGGWKVVALLRLSPAVPFNLLNYLFGLTPIRFWPCVLTSWAAMLPGTLLYVYLGHAGRSGLEAASGGRTRTPAEWALLGIGLAATVAVTLYVTRLARKALHERSTVASEPVGEPSAPVAPGWPWGTTALACIAVALVALAAYLLSRPDATDRRLPPHRTENRR